MAHCSVKMSPVNDPRRVWVDTAGARTGASIEGTPSAGFETPQGSRVERLG
jgi:hypothetical protein